jgi:hypothetical protein
VRWSISQRAATVSDAAAASTASTAIASVPSPPVRCTVHYKYCAGMRSFVSPAMNCSAGIRGDGGPNVTEA